jgi:POT family proton-dependent oligopeptide transporter
VLILRAHSDPDTDRHREDLLMASATATHEESWFGHPKGLFILFFTEMWERFSYYGMRSLLVLYMVNHLFLQPDVGQRVLGYTALKAALEGVFGPLANQALSSQIYGLYTGLVYFTPFFGGLLADRILGQRKTVVIGGILMAIGHFLMAVESMFFPALMFLILGNGCFKPNISTQVGLLYPQGDSRRDRAFSIFYVGINLGAFLAPLVCGTLGQKVGWHYGFAAAGVGMMLGLVIYLMNQKYLATDVLEQSRLDQAAAKSAGRVKQKEPLTRQEWLRIGVIVVACIIVASFWAVYEQQGNVMQLWADQNTNWNFFGWTMPSTWYQSFNPFMIFLITPLLTSLWAMQSNKGQEPSSLTKMAIGCVLLGLGFVVMIVASTGMDPNAKRSVFWLVGSTLVFTIGELYLSPIGLSFVTKVAPAAMVSMMMGVWFLANFIGNYMTGYLGTYWEKIPHSQFFMLMTGIAITAGLILFIIGRPLNKIVGGHDKLR